jgi:hypothetical protein
MDDVLHQALNEFLSLPPEEQRERMLRVELHLAENGDPDDPSAEMRACWALHHRALAGDPDPRLGPYRKPPQRTARRRRSANPRGRPAAGQARYDDEGHYIPNVRNNVWTELATTEAMALALVTARRRGYGMSDVELEQQESALREEYMGGGLDGMSKQELERRRQHLRELHGTSASDAAADILFRATERQVRPKTISDRVTKADLEYAEAVANVLARRAPNYIG